MQMRISVMAPVYNVQLYLTRCLDSILAKSICENLPISWLNYKKMRGELKL